ncbi:GNAT family N-acetyltransferase [Geodermatophilus sp. DSM 45219]|uniref:GNAT family N-acetyltransferase n=1 Tax=Geodermatophilus sp. DSM 45219 TaxID=1881103 RepID=UPI000884F207|nr:GNAT family N-acetyltransferase [Geodermatophilus sp. DSM 45219]SDO14909.1 Predicted acetyltransferase [Geodermatophilus sp. DSM 45219]
MTEIADRLRPATAEEWPAFSRAVFTTFGDEAPASFVDSVPAHAELDRTLGLWDGDRVVATSGVYSRELTVPGAVVPCAGVTWVSVAPSHRRQGVLTAVMRRQLTELHEQDREPVAALWASESSIYGRFGYAPATWRGNLSGEVARLRLRPGVDLGAGAVRQVGVEDHRAAAVGLHDRVRRLVPGNLARTAPWWDRGLHDEPTQRRGATERRFLQHVEPDGTVTGYAAYRVRSAWTDDGQPDGTVVVEEVRALTTPAYAALWQFLLSLDLVRTMRAPTASPDDPLRLLLAEPRALRSQPFDALWVRLVDVGRALAARRYPARVNLVLEVRDPFCPWNDGRWSLVGHPAGAFCALTDADPDLVLDVEALAAAYLGGVSLATLQAAGRVTEVSPGAVTQAATAFRWPVTPWCPDEF